MRVAAVGVLVGRAVAVGAWCRVSLLTGLLLVLHRGIHRLVSSVTVISAEWIQRVAGGRCGSFHMSSVCALSILR